MKHMPFTPENARQAQQRSAAVRQERWARERLASETAYRLVTELEDVHPAALSATLSLLRKIEDGTADLDVETWLDAQRAANTAEIAHRISRLASGQSTSNVAHAGDTDRAARIAELRARLEQHNGDDTTPAAPADTD